MSTAFLWQNALANAWVGDTGTAALPALSLGDSHAVSAGGDDWSLPSAILPGGEARTGYALGSGTPTVSEWD